MSVRNTKASAELIVILIGIFVAAVAGAVALPFIGGRNLFRGYDSDTGEPSGKVVALAVALIITGVILGSFTITPLLMILGSGPESQDQEAQFFFVALLVVALSAWAGVLYGKSERPQRLEMFAVARHNRSFLESVGIRETGQSDVTHYDADNQPLRYIETIDDRQIYMAVGRRNKRAYIYFDSTGRMVRYTGIVSL